MKEISSLKGQFTQSREVCHYLLTLMNQTTLDPTDVQFMDEKSHAGLEQHEVCK